MIRANDSHETLEDETPLARRRPGRDFKPFILLGIDKQTFYFDIIERF